MALAQKPRMMLVDEPLRGLIEFGATTVKSLIDRSRRDNRRDHDRHDMDSRASLAETVTREIRPRHVDGERDAVIADETDP